MLRSALSLLILAQLSFAQTATPAQPHQHQMGAAPAAQQQPPGASAQQPAAPTAPAPAAPAAPVAKAKPVAPTAPVITLPGVCEPPAGAAAKAPAATSNCKKVITRADFEKVIDAVVPKARRAEGQLTPQVKEAIARQYAEIIVMANEAKKRGIQRQPNVQELMRVSQLQLLAQALLQDLNERATPNPAETEKYYNENKPAFEEAILRRVFIPKETPPAAQPAAASGSEAKPSTPAAPAATTPDQAAQKASADKIRERAAAGEDVEKLQKDAFDFAKNTQTPPTTQLGPRRRGMLPPDHDAAVFALKPGEVSQLFDSPNGWYLYKVESKRLLPLAEVQQEISHRLQPQRFNDARSAIANSVKPELNKDYFGGPPEPVSATSPTQPGAAPHGAGGPRFPHGPAHPAPAQPPTPPTTPPQSEQPK